MLQGLSYSNSVLTSCLLLGTGHFPLGRFTETDYATRSFLLIIMFVWRGCSLIKNRAERTGWHKQSLTEYTVTCHLTIGPKSTVAC